MFNFLKPRQPQVTWWSSIKNLEKICPPVRSSHFVPKWFKEIEPCEYKDASNIKLCPSFMQYFSTGWVIPLWCDIQVGKNSVGEMYCETPHTDFRFEFHHDFQFKNQLPENEKNKIACVIKPISPWRVKISKGWSLMQLPMTYHFEDDWFCLSGILPSSVWHETNQQLVIKKSFFKDIKKFEIGLHEFNERLAKPSGIFASNFYLPKAAMQSVPELRTFENNLTKESSYFRRYSVETGKQVNEMLNDFNIFASSMGAAK